MDPSEAQPPKRARQDGAPQAGAAQPQAREGALLPLVAERLFAPAAGGGAAAALRDAPFEAAWRAAGGRACAPLLAAALAAAAARDARALALPAQALQDAAWEQLHSGHWSRVDVAWRDAYALSTLLAAAAAAADASTRQLRWALRQLDLAAMMGGPRFRPLVDEALAAAERALAAAAPAPPPRPRPLGGGAAAAPLPPGALADAARRVPVVAPPSLEAFLTHYMCAPGGGAPVVVRGAMAAWPAMARWRDAGYLAAVAGARTVPVEARARARRELRCRPPRFSWPRALGGMGGRTAVSTQISIQTHKQTSMHARRSASTTCARTGARG